MVIGYLLVITTAAEGEIVVPDAEVTIRGDQLKDTITVKTNEEGKTEKIPLPSIEIKDPDNPNQFYTYQVVVRKPGYQTVNTSNVQIFENHVTFLPIAMLPLSMGPSLGGRESILPVSGKRFD